MDKEQYKKLVSKKKPKESRCRNAIIAFIVGGFVGVAGEILSHIFVMCFGMSKVTSLTVVCLIMIFIGSLFTALGVFDDWVKKGKCGLIVPTTGFAHSVTSAAIEYKKDGLITGLGGNFFKLAGSVILYGIVSAFFLCLLGVICYG
ncbi:MAG: SpoVA/SpoVAEb family sporulation membrane protein [Firmicutes bacterium]|nr:SpoVA/SpoVAEb family sporulation membrane protein [Bacillota bacterium]